MSHSMGYPVTLGDRGRLVLPAAIREQLRLTSGDRFLLRVEEDGSIRLESFRAIAERNRGLFAGLAPGRSLVDELIAERRAEAARESAD
jgi:AbrB family looped-hinge helix DNA binding protein